MENLPTLDLNNMQINIEAKMMQADFLGWFLHHLTSYNKLPEGWRFVDLVVEPVVEEFKLRDWDNYSVTIDFTVYYYWENLNIGKGEKMLDIFVGELLVSKAEIWISLWHIDFPEEVWQSKIKL